LPIGRIAHFDYWSEKVRRSILLDARGDILLYGNAERAVVDLTHRLASGEGIETIDDLRGTAFMRAEVPPDYVEIDRKPLTDRSERPRREQTVIRMPSFEEVVADATEYARGSRILHAETNPGNARALVQAHGPRELWLEPPPIPLTTDEMDGIYDLPYARVPHP